MAGGTPEHHLGRLEHRLGDRFYSAVLAVQEFEVSFCGNHRRRSRALLKVRGFVLTVSAAGP